MYIDVKATTRKYLLNSISQKLVYLHTRKNSKRGFQIDEITTTIPTLDYIQLLEYAAKALLIEVDKDNEKIQKNSKRM